MIRQILLFLVACFWGLGHTALAATVADPTTELVPANPTIEPPAVVAIAPIKLPPIQTKKITVPVLATSADTDNVNRGHNSDLVHAARIAEKARLKATQVASSSTYVNAVAVYDYVPGEVYQVYTSPDYVTTLALKPGEKLISKVAGDTARWVIGDTVSGDGAEAKVLVVLKPMHPNLRTNLMLSTNQRVYQIDLVALSGNQYQNAVSWYYPQEELRDAEAKAAQITAQAKQTVLAGVSVENLNDGYSVKVTQGKTPEWLPTHVFDDGSKTYIAFPLNLGTTSAPPLFILGNDGKADLVNYRVKGHYYIVDRLFERAQLRLGEDPQTVVEIARDAMAVHTADGASVFSRR